MAQYIGFNMLIKKPEDFSLSEIFQAGPIPIFVHQVFVVNSDLPLWRRHFNMLASVAEKLNMPLAQEFYLYKNFLVRLVNRNKFFTGALVKLVFYPWGGKLNFWAFPQKIMQRSFLADRSLILVKRAGSYLKPKTFIDFVPQFDLHNYYIYNNTVLVQTPDGRILELGQGNFIVIHDGQVFSPTYHFGAYFNALQLELLDILKAKGFRINQEPFDYKLFEKAEQVWIVRDNYGVFYRVGIENFRYHYTSLYQECLNELNSRLGLI